MSGAATALDRRRATLLRRSDELRREIAGCAASVGERLGTIDGGVKFLRSRGGRLLLGATALLLLMRGPRRVLRVGARLSLLWPLLRPWLPRLRTWLRGGARAGP